MKTCKIGLWLMLTFQFLNNAHGNEMNGDKRMVSSYKPDQFELDIIDEINLARTNPGRYANFLEAWSEYYSGREIREPGKIIVLTQEGRAAVIEAIRFLKQQKPLNSLNRSTGLSLAARDMVRMQGSTTATGHIGSDGSTFYERISRYGTTSGHSSENIDYGNNRPRQIVMALIIDDGVKHRGHRTSLFTNSFRKIGVAFGSHLKYDYMCVIELADQFDEQFKP